MPGSVGAKSMVRRTALLLAVAVGLILTPAVATAQQGGQGDRRPAGGGGKKEALRRLAEGDRVLKRGDRLAARGKIEQGFTYFEAALSEYQAAYEAYPDPQIFFPIAQAEQRLGRFVDALQHYQQLLAESKTLSPALRGQVQIHLDEVRKNLAAVVLEIEPEGATILIDGKEAGRSPMSQPVFVEPGQHRYSVTGDGYESVEGVLDLPSGKEMRKRIRLERAPVASDSQDRTRRRRAAPRPSARPSSRERAPHRPSAVPLWIGVGVTGALAAGAGVTGAVALSKHGQYQDQSKSQASREAARRDGKQMASVTDILLGGALVAAGVTAYYYFAIYQPSAAEADRGAAIGQEREAAVRFAPLVGGDVAGLAVSGTFW